MSTQSPPRSLTSPFTFEPRQKPLIRSLASGEHRDYAEHCYAGCGLVVTRSEAVEREILTPHYSVSAPGVIDRTTRNRPTLCRECEADGTTLADILAVSLGLSKRDRAFAQLVGEIRPPHPELRASQLLEPGEIIAPVTIVAVERFSYITTVLVNACRSRLSLLRREVYVKTSPHVPHPSNERCAGCGVAHVARGLASDGEHWVLLYPGTVCCECAAALKGEFRYTPSRRAFAQTSQPAHDFAVDVVFGVRFADVLCSRVLGCDMRVDGIAEDVGFIPFHKLKGDRPGGEQPYDFIGPEWVERASARARQLHPHAFTEQGGSASRPFVYEDRRSVAERQSDAAARSRIGREAAARQQQVSRFKAAEARLHKSVKHTAAMQSDYYLNGGK